FQILSNLRTKDVVTTSVLSPRWRTVWRSVPNFDLDSSDFGRDYNAPVSFSVTFLRFNTDLCLRKFSLIYHWIKKNNPGGANFKRWINAAVDRRVQRIHVCF
ncbi:unnamed protein product, partial [Brassica oleracea]